MTPLAHRIAKELTLPLRKRTLVDEGNVLRRMDDVHCFEVTAVFGVAHELMPGIGKGGLDRLAFLPAPRTWIELQNDRPHRHRAAWHLEERDGMAVVTSAIGMDEAGSFRTTPFGLLMLQPTLADGGRGGIRPVSVWRPEVYPALKQVSGLLYALLALINTPRVIGRTTHAPHAGLERALLARRPLIGHFPLHAWNEIHLEVTPPVEAGEAQETHLTGARALHFVRTFMRIRLGQLEMVRCHWRGDAALGIKQQRYRVESGPRTAEVVEALKHGKILRGGR